MSNLFKEINLSKSKYIFYKKKYNTYDIYRKIIQLSKKIENKKKGVVSLYSKNKIDFIIKFYALCKSGFEIYLNDNNNKKNILKERINIHYYFKNNNLIKLNSLKSNFVNNKLIILKTSGSTNLNKYVYLTQKNISDPIKLLLKKYIITFDKINIYEFNKSDYIKCFINGIFIGYTSEIVTLLNDFKNKRSQSIINIHTSIFWNSQENYIQIWSDEGRPIRPLLTVKNNKLLYTKDIAFKLREKIIDFNDLLLSKDDSNPAILEYIDPYETNNILISTYTKDINNCNYNCIWIWWIWRRFFIK